MIEKIVNTGYEALASGILAAFIAQIIKFFIFTIKTKKIIYNAKHKKKTKYSLQQVECLALIQPELWDLQQL